MRKQQVPSSPTPTRDVAQEEEEVKIENKGEAGRIKPYDLA